MSLKRNIKNSVRPNVGNIIGLKRKDSRIFHLLSNEWIELKRSLKEFPMQKSEREFADFLESKGKTWIYHPGTFKLTLGGFKSYEPDFYCYEDDIFYEVKTSLTPKDAERMLIFKKEYPSLKLKIVSSNGVPFYSNLSGLIFKNILNDIEFFMSKDILDFTMNDYEKYVTHFFSYQPPDKRNGNRIKRIPIYRQRVQLVEKLKNKILDIK